MGKVCSDTAGDHPKNIFYGLDPQDFGYLGPDPDPRGKYQLKAEEKTFLLLKPKSELLKKERL